jgi:long-chain acyl-CoA synthetase
MLETGPHVPVTAMAGLAKTTGQMFKMRALRSRQRPAMYRKDGHAWRSTTWGRFYEQATRVAAGLQALELKPGDRVAILGPTQEPWAVYDMGSQLAGLVSLGIYPKQAAEQIRYIVDHSDARVVFVDGDDEIEQVLEALQGLDKVLAIVPWSEEQFQRFKDRDDRITSPADFDKDGLDDDAIDEIQQGLDPEETAILVYTSGTTGPPKGAMISHRNILAVLERASDFLQLYEDDLSFNFLPMAHVAERVLGFYGRINSGICTAYASSISVVLAEVQEVQPTMFGSVPRIFEKAYGKIHSEVEKKPPLVQKIFAFASAVAREASPYRVSGRAMPLPLALRYAIADRLVFQKVRGAFGGRVRQFVTGAAPIAYDILEFFWGAGLDVYEVYGMTEATVVTHANRQGQVKLGTVGRIIEGLEQKVAEDGEILIRGPFVFKGYFKNEQVTAETVIDDWLHTGDIGTIDADGSPTSKTPSRTRVRSSARCMPTATSARSCRRWWHRARSKHSSSVPSAGW